MSNQSFNQLIERENTACIKYDMRDELFGKSDVMPLWVADMDFRAPDFILDRLHKRVDHGIFGYTFIDDEFYHRIIDWNKKRNNWEIKKEWILFSAGIVPALNYLVNVFTKEGDEIIVQPPVYYPFFSAVRAHRRKLIQNELKLEDGKYRMDLDDLISQITSKTRMLILCNPHNPTGNAWTPEELKEIAQICIDNNILIISDEIHSDLIYNGHKHTPMASLSKEISMNTITCMAPSKTFNLAALGVSYLITENDQLYNKYKSFTERFHVAYGNVFAYEALKAAYKEGADWVDDMMVYVQDNFQYLNEFLATNIPDIVPIQPEATYLVWLDCRKLDLDRKALKKFIIHDAGLGLNDGPVFGPGGEGFQRINLACPRQTLEKALSRLKEAYDQLTVSN